MHKQPIHGWVQMVIYTLVLVAWAVIISIFIAQLLFLLQAEQLDSKVCTGTVRQSASAKVACTVHTMTVQTLSPEMLVKKYGIVLENYVQLIIDIYNRHHSFYANVRNNLAFEDQSNCMDQCNIAITTSSCDVALTIQNCAFLDYLGLATFRDEIKDFDKLCVNVEVNFHRQTTTYTLSNSDDLQYNRKPHYFYNTRPFFRSGELQSTLEEHIQLCTRNNKLHDLTKRVIRAYVYHCSKVPRFSVYEEQPNENVIIVCISGIEELNAHFLTHLTNLMHTYNITAWIPKCNAELRCEFHLDALKAESRNAEPRPNKRRFFGLF